MSTTIESISVVELRLLRIRQSDGAVVELDARRAAERSHQFAEGIERAALEQLARAIDVLTNPECKLGVEFARVRDGE